jgi:hypothetical protein
MVTGNLLMDYLFSIKLQCLPGQVSPSLLCDQNTVTCVFSLSFEEDLLKV